MAKASHLILILLCLCIATAAMATARMLEESDSDTEFIRTSCKATTYPNLCFKSLSVFASDIKKKPRQLAETALQVSISRAQSAKAFVSKLASLKGITKRQHEAIMDCIEEMSDSVDRLSKSFQELKRSGQVKGNEDFSFCMSNVQTWVSAALTDENTCLDGFAGRGMDGELKSSIREHVVDVAQETSNALALINHFASSRH